MPKFSKTSRGKLGTCHEDLQTIFEYVIKYFDCTIVCGHRTEEKQNAAFKKGYSKVKFPNSQHNSLPSMAVDAIPWPIEWDNHDRMRYFAGYVMGIAKMLKVIGEIEHSVRWGGDWDRDTLLKDQRFIDLPHFELR
jgi:peptidoglycan L-alanyl-D-glutamate endopeptidase CwlK